MKKPIAFARIFFVLTSMLFMTVYYITVSQGHTNIAAAALAGSFFGFLAGSVLIGFDLLLKRFDIRSFNTTALGLFFGYLMGQALITIFNSMLDTSPITASPEAAALAKQLLLLAGCYLGLVITLRTADEIAVSIPFIHLKKIKDRKKDILIDSSVLSDTRIIDLAATGLFDHHLIVPRFIINELHSKAEHNEEIEKTQARRALDTLKKLEALPSLGLRYDDNNFTDLKEEVAKLVKLGRMADAHILTADLNKIQVASIEGVKIININVLSNALKPLMQAGESILIKIQRFGKEPKQGVGYLEDGTMVVVNGGGDFVGEMVRAQVLSVKHTSSGRMVFCNAQEDSLIKTANMAVREKNPLYAQPVR